MIRLAFTIMRRPWRCNSDRTASIATRIFRRILWKRASALTNVRSVRTASRTSCTTYARTVAAVSSRGRSGLQRNGVLDCRSRSVHRRTSACICPIAWTISPRIRPGFGIFRRGTVNGPPVIASEAKQSIDPKVSVDCFLASLLAMTERIILPPLSSPRLRQSRHGSHRPGTSRA
jgi:hypothetical protein